MQAYWRQCTVAGIRRACTPFKRLPLQSDDRSLLGVGQDRSRHEVCYRATSLAMSLTSRDGCAHLRLIDTLGILPCIADSRMGVSPTTPSRGLWVWALTLGTLLGSACEGRSCESAIHPKVALLFLTRAEILHQDLWERWLSSAANLTDILFAQRQLCSRDDAEHQEECKHGEQTSYAFGQRLFSLYIHTGANKHLGSKAGPAQPMDRFAKFRIRSSITAEWGQPTLIMAERLLLQTALKDEENQRFVLLSESCIPLYSPQLIYQQLMGELRSRINACKNWRGTDDHIQR